MELKKQSKLIKEYIDLNKDEITKQVKKGHVTINILKLDKDLLKDELKTILRWFEILIKKQYNLKPSIECIKVPKKFHRNISDILAEDIDKLIYIEGKIIKRSKVHQYVTRVKFECPSCGNIILVLQLDAKYKIPSRCGCGRKGNFREMSKDLVDVVILTLQEKSHEIQVFARIENIPDYRKKLVKGKKIRCIGHVELENEKGSTKLEQKFIANTIKVV